jgi:hypothetical protein
MALLEADAALLGDSGFLSDASVVYSIGTSLVGSSVVTPNLGGRFEVTSVQSGGSLFFTSPPQTSVSNTLRGPQIPVAVVPVVIPPIKVGPIEIHRPAYSVDTSSKRRGQ